MLLSVTQVCRLSAPHVPLVTTAPRVTLHLSSAMLVTIATNPVCPVQPATLATPAQKGPQVALQQRDSVAKVNDEFDLMCK